MKNDELKAEADLLVLSAGLPQLLAEYPRWFIGGSYSYNLMCWRDLDIYVLDPERELKECFAVAFEVTRRLSAIKSRFTNNLGGEPDGYYWGIKLGDIRANAWKLDIWFLNQAGYQQHAAYSEEMNRRLNPDTGSRILKIKEAYWRRQEFRDTVTSHLIYRAVLEHHVKEVSEFEQFVKMSLQI